MKRILALSLALLILLVGCSSTPSPQETTTPAPSDSGTPTDSAPDVTPTEEPNNSEEYYFKDDVLVSEDVKIEITDWRVIPVGETGNEYGDGPVIAFWYSVTNLSGNDGVTPLGSWIAMFTAIQDNDPNLVNELEVASFPDERFLDTQMENIKKDGTVECAMAYTLDDLTTPVVLKATRGILGEDLGEQTFEIAK